MGTGEYICVTLRGGAPWGFSVREGEGDTYTPFHVYQCLHSFAPAFLRSKQEELHMPPLTHTAATAKQQHSTSVGRREFDFNIALHAHPTPPGLQGCVQEGGAASQAGVRHGDEVVSLNGEPCGDLRLAEALYLINASTDCLQLLLKR
ncbi:Synaptopodin-2 [Merluccius polli]|uniref:Synaptopodin-2 n=1 Tax=Merluccius polli TaxID=89951 RepID=A0AA47P5D5_MERPO|nr:Synaptopodin-2 [Merluccius polli]